MVIGYNIFMSEREAGPVSKHEQQTSLYKLMGLIREATIQRPKVEGLHNLQEIPEDQPVIFAVSHLSDADVPAAAEALLHYRSLDIVILQTGVADLKQKPFIYLAGRYNFHTVKNTFNLRTQTPHTRFNQADFKEMKEAMQRGRDMMIAAHNPTRNWQLPDNPGIGAVYLAQITGAPIVPVVLDIHSETPVGMAHDITGALSRLIRRMRPEATLRIGQAMMLEKLEAEQLSNLVRLLQADDRIQLRTDPQQYQKAKKAFRKTYGRLKEQAELVMNELALLLPPKKRGGWGAS